MIQGPETFKGQIKFFHYLKGSEIGFTFKVNLSKDLFMPRHMHKMQVSMRVYIRREQKCTLSPSRRAMGNMKEIKQG